MMVWVRVILVLAFSMGLNGSAETVQRFPPPDFESGYVFPETQMPLPRGELFSYLDIVLLAAALSTAAYLVVVKRSRQGLFILTIGCLVYFGFIREGCVCPVGATQNVTLALFQEGYAIPVTVISFFMLPLLFSLFFGRIFCAGVCPLGAIQDLVLVKPLKIPQWLNQSLGLVPYLYLGAAVLFAALGSAFIICEYDPFVAFFRMSGNRTIVILGLVLLGVSVFVGRPYCLFLCPYSVLLRFFTRFSQWRLTVAPEACFQCQKCDEACPFGAIHPPTPKEMPAPTREDRRRTVTLMILLPVLMASGGWVTSWAGKTFSHTHFKVSLAERIILEDLKIVEGVTDESKAFRNSGVAKEVLLTEARRIQNRFTTGSWFLGGFLGLVVGCKLLELSRVKKRTFYEVDTVHCVACGRCFPFCPLNTNRNSSAAAKSDDRANGCDGS